MLSEIRTGPITSNDGAINPGRATKDGATVASQAHGIYHEPTYRGNVFSATNQAAQAVSVALATTYTGLAISNPLGNIKNLIMLGCNWAHSVAPVGIATLHLIAGYSAITAVTHTTPLGSPGIQNSLIGTGPVSTAKADTAATIVNPGFLIPIGSGFTAGSLYGTTPAWIDLGGQFIIPPGGWIAIGALTAVTGFGGFSWEEAPL